MATQAKVIISATDKLSPALKQTEKNLQSFSQGLQKIGSFLQTAIPVGLIVGAVKKVSDSLGGMYDDFKEAERAYKQLAISMGDSKSYDKAVDTIKRLSKQTLSSKGDVESMVAELSALGKSADEIDSISTAAVALSNVTGKDLNTSMTTLLGTFNGTTSSLKKMGIDVSNLTKDELANGAAVDLVIEKFGALNEELANNNSKQSLKNIKDTLGDIKQSFGDLVDFSITPLVAKFDVMLSDFQGKFDGLIQNIKIVLSNFPEFFSRLGQMVWSMLVHLLENLPELVMTRLKVVGQIVSTALQTLSNLFTTLIPQLGTTILSYVRYLVSKIADTVGINITDLINSIGEWLTESPIGKVIDKTISTLVNGIRLVGNLIKNIPQMVKIVFDNILPIITNTFKRLGVLFTAIGQTAKDTFRYIGEILVATFSWDSIKTIITTLFKNIGTIATTMFKTLFVNIPKLIGSVVESGINWVAYFVVHVKNSFLQMVEDVVRQAGNKIQNTWLGKFLGMGDGLANFSIGIDRTSENNLKSKAQNNSIGDNLSKVISDAIDMADTIKENNEQISKLYEDIDGITVYSPQWDELDDKDFWSGLGSQFAELLNPVFEQFTADSSETIGQKMAVWVQKSSDEYKQMFEQDASNLKDVFKTFGLEFITDVKTTFNGVSTTVGDALEGIFGDDVNAFKTWLSSFIDANRTATTSTSTSSASSTSNAVVKQGYSLSLSNPFAKDTWDDEGNLVKGGMFSKASSLEALSESFNSTISSFLGEFSTIIEAVASGAPWIVAIIEIIKGFAEEISPLIHEIIDPIFDFLQGIGREIADAIMPIVEELFPMVQGALPLLKSLVSPIISIIKVTTSIAQVFHQMLLPVIEGLTKALTYVSSFFEWVFFTVGHFVTSFLNGLSNLHIGSWYPFKNTRVQEIASPGSLGSFVKSRVDAVGEGFSSSAVSASTTANGISTQNASYSGGNTLTINIYQQAPVVGDGGMEQFAMMIRTQFENLSYYNV